MKSAIKFDSDVYKNDDLLHSIYCLFEWCRDVAEYRHKKVDVLLQHSLREDEFAVLVEVDDKKFGHHSINPKEAIDIVERQVAIYFYETAKKEEHSSGTKGS